MRSPRSSQRYEDRPQNDVFRATPDTTCSQVEYGTKFFACGLRAKEQHTAPRASPRMRAPMAVTNQAAKFSTSALRFIGIAFLLNPFGESRETKHPPLEIFGDADDAR